MADVRNITNKPASMGPGKILRTPRVPVDKKGMKPKANTRDYQKAELQAIKENGGFGFGRTAMDAED